VSSPGPTSTGTAEMDLEAGRRRVAITGAAGFLGWHTRVVAHADGRFEVRPIDRQIMADPVTLAAAVEDVDHLVHLAGINRGDDRAVHDGNLELAQRLTTALRQAVQRPSELSFANSIQSSTDSPYGCGKREASALLASTCRELGIEYHDVILPNLFGEHGRPNYNSVVATFCSAIAGGAVPEIHDDKVLSLLGVRDAVDQLLPRISDDRAAHRSPTAITVSQLRETLIEFESCYRLGEIPRIDTTFRTQLFNTYRSFTFPERFPIGLTRHNDARGTLIETARVHGGGGLSFVSTTAPGVTRGQHFHLDKVERFVVVEGSATISLRRLLSDEVVTFQVSGDQPAIVDMPTLWAHNITNVGDTTLYTQFWSDQLFNAAAPDTYYEMV
jgi:UDP-2-acetamido-2,6-beta-L-arabino-hexul-4-ose reductase